MDEMQNESKGLSERDLSVRYSHIQERFRREKLVEKNPTNQNITNN
jgi:hypothetical protein